MLCAAYLHVVQRMEDPHTQGRATHSTATAQLLVLLNFADFYRSVNLSEICHVPTAGITYQLAT